MPKNKFSDLNDHLFAQLERLSDEQMTDAQLEKEVVRSEAIVAVSEQILRQAALQVQAAKIISDHGLDPTSRLPDIPRNPLLRHDLRVVNGKPS